MKKFMAFIALVIIFSVLVSGCSQTKATDLPAQAGPTSAPISSLDGKTILESQCTVCHSLDRVTAKSADLAGWEKTVKKMISNGAALTPEEQTVLVQYLADTYK